MSLTGIINTLGLSEANGLCFSSNNEWKNRVNLPIRTEETLLEINPDAFFCINNEPLILFFENPLSIKELEKKIWNFNQSPAIFIKINNKWIIKNGFKYLKGKEELATLSNDISEFEYFKIITGKTWEENKEHFENKNRVDTYLLQNIEEARNILMHEGLHSKIANSLIGRIIFIRYLIDRKVELNKYNILTREDFYNILKNKNSAYTFFTQLKFDFNGNLFPLEYEVEDEVIIEKDAVSTTHLSTIISLLKGDRLIGGAIQQSMFDIYDFSIIPIEFVSNVYEKFIGVLNQAKNGAYYTPLFLVDYIQSETVAKYFNIKTNEYNCKVLDPACGSGIFLVETLRQIISKFKTLNPKAHLDEIVYKSSLKKLLVDNIFGIDKDENAISVAIFSLYITLLDYIKPSSIVGFQFPPLIGTNFFCNDFFDIAADFNILSKSQHFHFIFGNPPWATKHPKAKQVFEKYIENRKINEKSDLEIVHREIAEAFLVRVSDFSFDECAFIIVSKILYKLEKKAIFRQYFLNNFKIRQVFELSSVRHQVFDKSNDKAVAPATILFYCNRSSENNNNLIAHISIKPNIFFEIFKLMVIEKYDYKEILQENLILNDWLWKVLVYGNLLDFGFIKRLKAKFPTIEKVTSDEQKFIKGQGLKFKDGEKIINTSAYSDYCFIGSLDKKITKSGLEKDAHTNYNNFVKAFYVEPDLKKWDGRDVGYFPENPIIFEPPCLLVTGGITSEFKSVSAILGQKALFKSSLTAIKAINPEDINILESIVSILNSSFFSYYILLNGSSTGIEREETHDEEKWSVPFVSSKKLSLLVSNVGKSLVDFYSSVTYNDYLSNNIKTLNHQIDEEIYNLFQLSKQELFLIDYSNCITVPLLKGSDIEKKKVLRKLKYQDRTLKNYAEIFINHFGQRFNSKDGYFEVEIIYSHHTIMMKFKVISEPSKEQDKILWRDTGDKELLENIANLSFENLSNNLFMQKDVSGIENKFFYIAKPNQYKLWHPALAYLDLSEFIEAFHNSTTPTIKN